LLISVDGWNILGADLSSLADKRKPALDELRVCDVAESLTLDEDLRAALFGPVSW
jgi:hypothetical protein